jgi:membrane protease YdiL (CAAX protease family)
VALVLPPAIVGTALAVAVATGTTPTFPWADQPIVLFIAFVWIFVLGGPIQEEFGWRGYLLDPLQERLTALGGGLAVGLVWAVWHLPLFYIPSETIYYQNLFLGFAVSITLLSVLMTWVYNSTNGSLLPALLMHTSWNWAHGDVSHSRLRSREPRDGRVPRHRHHRRGRVFGNETAGTDKKGVRV